MAEKTRAAALFERFTCANGIDELMKLVPPGPPCFEDEWLDFKTGATKEKDIQRIWSKAISAFANNEGGVLVWGIRAEKDPQTEIDRAHTIEEVPDPLWLRSRLTELAPFACDPPVQGIVTKELVTANGKGFVVCLIPESGQRPHRAEHSNREFYIRIGDAAKPCTVSLLRQLFYPRRSSRLEVGVFNMPIPPSFPTVHLHNAREPGNNLKAVLDLVIENKSGWSIEHVYFSLDPGAGVLFSYDYDNIDGKFRLEALNTFNRVARILHPGMRTRTRIALATSSHQDVWPFEFSLYAKDFQRTSIQIPFQATFNFSFTRSVCEANIAST